MLLSKHCYWIRLDQWLYDNGRSSLSLLRRMTQMRISTVAIRKGSNTELQQLLTLLDPICKLTNLQWNKDLMKILHQCKEAADLREASLYER